MSRFVVDVPLRWSDQDAFGHVNHARTVTLLEDARVALLFDRAAADGGLTSLSTGLLVAAISVDYRLPIPYRPHPVRTQLWVHGMRAASFLVEYLVHRGPSEDDPVAATAQTKMVPYDLASGRPRRLSDAERGFLAQWSSD
ncbi:MAG: acyl-CoA thioesterase [Pseudonocardiales bacterium]|nr:acyl-CoA thioesterase [Pseudonocardiales bacterium]